MSDTVQWVCFNDYQRDALRAVLDAALLISDRSDHPDSKTVRDYREIRDQLRHGYTLEQLTDDLCGDTK